MTLLMPKIYEASSVVLIEKEANSQKSLLFRMNVRKDEDDFDWIRSEIEIMRSFPVASSVVRELPVAQEDIAALLTEAGFSERVENFQKNLSVENPRESNILKIAYRAKRPAETVLVIEKVIRAYEAYRAEIFNQSDTYNFYEEQIGYDLDDINDLQYIKTFKDKYKLIREIYRDIDPIHV